MVPRSRAMGRCAKLWTEPAHEQAPTAALRADGALHVATPSGRRGRTGPTDGVGSCLELGHVGQGEVGGAAAPVRVHDAEAPLLITDGHGQLEVQVPLE